mmetsp:Transcript_18665/g.46605  ORF Transcript_18665/g.46605 Transcript_18665/m.46605 type:complete len:336 (-) Transcript_18665:481-1488(-)|eukprot:CAMPEP_0178990984 /NCGR_PEP_ID=MMETSP0795-20121207/5268_1 /TAXON_ID=88552 /ORGANISM="Amoebophrya sp., Strain Ameob2" /LENGTH=335 /DNA_ID=CAMNT_0020682627 /DNA_START=478 /DNA_END=1485 /DNA_ORIENTATION=-
MNADQFRHYDGTTQRPAPSAPLIHKSPEMMPAVSLGKRYNWGHQCTPSGRSLFPVPPVSEFHRSINQQPEMGNLWVDGSNTYEDARLSTQPYHMEKDMRTMTGYSYDRKVPPGTYVEPKVFNLGNHVNWKTRPLDKFQQARMRRDSRCYSVPKRGTEGVHHPVCVFVGFVEWTMERAAMTRGEMDRLMYAACAAKYPCSRPATYEEYISHGIAGLPTINQTKFDVTFIGPGSEKLGPGVLDHKNTNFARKKIVFPGDRMDGSSGQIEIDDSSCWGRKACLAVVYNNRLRQQPSLKQFGLLRNTLSLKDSTNVQGDATQWDTFNHLYKQNARVVPL